MLKEKMLKICCKLCEHLSEKMYALNPSGGRRHYCSAGVRAQRSALRSWLHTGRYLLESSLRMLRIWRRPALDQRERSVKIKLKIKKTYFEN